MHADPDSVASMALSDPAICLLQRIGRYLEEHGYGPSVRDLQGGPGLLGRSQVAYHRNRLAERGLIVFDRGMARSIRMTKKGQRVWISVHGKRQ